MHRYLVDFASRLPDMYETLRFLSFFCLLSVSDVVLEHMKISK
jgi:hypothetical protein